jgi:hypothetical protein
MSDVSVRWLKCVFCGGKPMEPGRAVCAECYAKHQAEPEPTSAERLTMVIVELQIDVEELRWRLAGRRPEPEVETAERRVRWEQTLAVVQAALGEKQTGV